MGTLKVTIAVGDSQGRQFEELDVTVDTGSTYTAVPRAMLNRMGDPGRKVATLRDCRRQHSPRRRRRSHHQAALCKATKSQAPKRKPLLQGDGIQSNSLTTGARFLTILVTGHWPSTI